jgi:hypothetical protein
MNLVLAAAILFVSSNAFALGPIPNGTYAGTENCSVGSYPTQLTFTDTTLAWDGQTNSFDFGPNSNGFFKVSTTSGMSGSGLGHFTENGVHYEIVFDYPSKDGTTHPAPGEDSFTYSNGVVHLESSASAGPGGKITCGGDFALVR